MLKDLIEATISSDPTRRTEALPILKLLAAVASDTQGAVQALHAVIAEIEAGSAPAAPSLGQTVLDVTGAIHGA